jgi:phage FluMu protein Com
MANIKCPKCKHVFDNNSAASLVTRSAAAAAGAATGAWLLSETGMVLGPLGGINGAWIGGTVGGLSGFLAADQFRRCPKCGKIFKK